MKPLIELDPIMNAIESALRIGYYGIGLDVDNVGDGEEAEVLRVV